jgi:hypothetical protein
MDHIALDAVELIEILQYFTETLDRVSEHDGLAPVIGNLDPYRISDLHADIARHIERLQRSQLTPLTTHRSIDLLGVRRDRTEFQNARRLGLGR